MKKTLYLLGLYLMSSAVLADLPNHKQLVENAFIQWEEGKGSPFELIAEQATWTIMGPTESAKTYNMKAFREQVVIPFNKRLATPLKPDLLAVYQEQDEVIVLFEAQATLINGEFYKNSYAWFFTMHNGEVINVRAVLDLHAYDAVMALNVDDK